MIINVSLNEEAFFVHTLINAVSCDICLFLSLSSMYDDVCSIPFLCFLVTFATFCTYSVTTVTSTDMFNGGSCY